MSPKKTLKVQQVFCWGFRGALVVDHEGGSSFFFRVGQGSSPCQWLFILGNILALSYLVPGGVSPVRKNMRDTFDILLTSLETSVG